jgi:hypothetical protein
MNFFFSVARGVQEEDRKELLERLEENPFLSLQKEFSTSYKRKRFVKNTGNYIHPQEIKLPPNSSGEVRTFQYIPVTELLKAIADDPGFSRQPLLASEDGMLHDVKDGAFWRDSEYFKNNREALAIMVYSDELEVCNPLGASKGKQKIMNIYITLAEIPKQLRYFPLI